MKLKTSKTKLSKVYYEHNDDCWIQIKWFNH